MENKKNYILLACSLLGYGLLSKPEEKNKRQLEEKHKRELENNEEEKLVKLIEEVENCAVSIITNTKTGWFDLFEKTTLGSGFIIEIDEQKYVITNDHVIQNTNEIKIINNDKKIFDVIIVGQDALLDLAILQIQQDVDPINLKPISLGDSQQSKVGQTVIAIGNSYGFSGTVTSGIISAKNRLTIDGNEESYLQTDASINVGNSGGPLINMKGEVIGMNTMILSPNGGSIGLGFSLPINIIEQNLEQLLDFGKIKRVWIGIRFKFINNNLFVTSVDKKGPAHQFLKKGDIIMEYDSIEVTDEITFVKYIRSKSVGENLTLLIKRKKKELERIINIQEWIVSDYIYQRSVNNILIDDLKVSPLEKNKRNFSQNIEGVKISKINKKSPLFNKLYINDIITKINNYQIKNTDNLNKILKSNRKSYLNFEVIKPNNQIVSIKIELETQYKPNQSFDLNQIKGLC
ncbi:Trypsin-like peptidase domain [seawater metagenome]|uniref:Trypsin-like peptidase domain n=1 Tax=seawater metagenome TaxID=1561972 RepID=A0A5E8CIX1_9ZZZZ